MILSEIILTVLAGLLLLDAADFCRGDAGGAAAQQPAARTPEPAAGAWWVYVGTYTGPNQKGLELLRLDRASGALTVVGLAAELPNPTFLAVHPRKNFLYAISEVDQQSCVAGFAIAAATGGLTPLNRQPTSGSGPCHITLDAAGRYALVANYGSGSVAVLPIAADGTLGAATAFVQHQGSSIDPERQQGPHAHGIYPDPAGRFVLAADLGLDQILVYRFDQERGTLTAGDPAFAAVAPGAGPRHLAFHPNGRFVYVINEMGNTVTGFAYDAARGRLREVQTIATLPADFRRQSSTAEVAVHPSGKFLFGSNRGHDSIVVFAIDPSTGRLTLTGHYPTLGRHPRHFAIDPTGTFLLVANRDTDNIVVFRIDPVRGALTPTGNQATVRKPVCVTFYEAGR